MILGRELKEICDRFIKKLDTEALVNEWIEKTQKREWMANKRIFQIDKQQREGKLILKIDVNFASDIMVIAKEVCVQQVFVQIIQSIFRFAC